MYSEKVGFAIGTGRCGTKLAHVLMNNEKGVASSHERNAIADSFHRYCQWYCLPVDDEGFLETKRCEIKNDLAKFDFSFEASAYLSLSVKCLHAEFGGKYILFVRNPESVVNSYITKGWYLNPSYRANSMLAPGFQPNQVNIHHSFSRIMPSGVDYEQWNSMGRIGKLAWYWNTLNDAILQQFQEIPPEDTMIIRLEDYNFCKYKEMLSFLGRVPSLTEMQFERISNSRPNRSKKTMSCGLWSQNDWNEFSHLVAPMAKRFDYKLQPFDSSLNEEILASRLECKQNIRTHRFSKALSKAVNVFVSTLKNK